MSWRRVGRASRTPLAICRLGRARRKADFAPLHMTAASIAGTSRTRHCSSIESFGNVVHGRARSTCHLISKPEVLRKRTSHGNRVDHPRQFPRQLPSLNLFKPTNGHFLSFLVLCSWFFVLTRVALGFAQPRTKNNEPRTHLFLINSDWATARTMSWTRYWFFLASASISFRSS